MCLFQIWACIVSNRSESPEDKFDTAQFIDQNYEMTDNQNHNICVIKTGRPGDLDV